MERLVLKVIEYIKKERLMFIVGIVIFLSIRIGYNIYLYEFKYINDETNKKMYVTVIEKRKETEDKLTYLVEYENSKFIMNIYNIEDTSIEVFDVLQIRGKVIIPKCLNNPHEFNYKRYLNSVNIIGTISAYNIKKIGESKKYDLNILTKFRNNLLEKSKNMLGKDESTLFNSMICGIKNYNDTTIQKYFRESGSSHFLSISGTHIMYFLYVVELFVQKFSRNTKRNIKVIFIILFNFMIGFEVSLLRASIMYVITCFDFEKVSINKYLKLIISFLVIFSFNPYIIFNPSFIFSYLSIIAMITLLPLFNSFFNILLFKIFKLKYMGKDFLEFSKFKKLCFYILKYVLKNVAFVIAIYIVTIPFQMYFFCEINFVSIISNIILTPFISFELMLGFLSLFLVNVPYVSDVLILSNNVVLSFVIFLVKHIASIDILKISVVKPDILSIIFYYIIFSIFIFSKYLYKFFSIKKSKKIKRIFKIVTIFFSLYIISIYIKVSFFEEYVYFFNVGQGNMALIHKENTNVVVDLGSTSISVANNILINFLKAKNISKIDMIIITHMHEDHMNGVEEVIENVEVSKVIFSSFEDKGKNENFEFERMVKRKNISTLNVEMGDSIIFRDFKIDVLSPPKDKIINSSDILNSNSLVLLISKKNHNYLFLGDATKETEEFIFKEKNYDEEIYKRLNSLSAVQIGHHGSKTSTSDILLKNINNCIAIISSKKKKFGHPSDETLKILKKYNFDIMITEKEGAIKIK